MILQDLLKTLTKENYLQIGAIHKEWVSFLQPNVSAKRIANTMQDFGEMLSNLPVAPSEYILLALPTFESGSPETHAELFLKDSLLEKHSIISERNMPQYQETDPKEVFTKIIQDTADYLPNSYGYEFSPWEMVLGATVLPENFDQSETGKIPFIASALFNMSFNGTSVEAQKKAEKICMCPWMRLRSCPKKNGSAILVRWTTSDWNWAFTDQRRKGKSPTGWYCSIAYGPMSSGCWR